MMGAPAKIGEEFEAKFYFVKDSQGNKYIVIDPKSQGIPRVAIRLSKKIEIEKGGYAFEPYVIE